jgi:ADP-ribosylglycohydrolase
LTHPTKLFSQFQGTRYLVAGQVTDDTEMTLALLNSMVQQRRYDRDSVVLAYLKWANSGNVAMGTNTRDLMKGVTTLRGYNSRYTKSLNGTSKFMQNSEHYTTLMDVQSNGTLMRCSPLALLPEAERVNAIIHDVDITNPNPVNRECSTIYLFALSQLLRIGEEQDSLTTLVETYERCVARATQLPILNVFLEINSGSPRDVTQSKGWVVHAFYAAMHSLRLIIDGVVSSYSEAINMIVMLGGDTDTNAAIAGALIGAYYGYTKMYCEETTNYNLCVLMGADTSQGDFPRPELYSPRGIDVALKAWIEQRH